MENQRERNKNTPIWKFFIMNNVVVLIMDPNPSEHLSTRTVKGHLGNRWYESHGYRYRYRGKQAPDGCLKVSHEKDFKTLILFRTYTCKEGARRELFIVCLRSCNHKVKETGLVLVNLYPGYEGDVEGKSCLGFNGWYLETHYSVEKNWRKGNTKVKGWKDGLKGYLWRII